MVCLLKCVFIVQNYTFSRSRKYGPTIIVENIQDVQLLCEFIQKKRKNSLFNADFWGKYSTTFNVKTDLIKIGVVNQTTMLASETKEIIDLFTKTLKKTYGEANISNHIANTRDTLCYATNENQESTLNLLKEPKREKRQEKT